MPQPALTTLLDEKALAALRAAYALDPGSMLTAARAAVAEPFPEAAGYVNWVVDHLYDGKSIEPVAREHCLIALLASQTTSNSLLLAVHLYWGLMVGLSVADIANTLALSGAYTGLPHYTAGLTTLRITLGALARASATPGAKLDPANAVRAVATALAPPAAAAPTTPR